MKKRLIFALFLILIILISGCKGKNGAKPQEEVRTGTEGIAISFLPNAPPEKIHVEQGSDNTFEVVLVLRNKGAYPQPGESSGIGPAGRVFLSGYDPLIIDFKSKDGKSADLSTKTLEGKSTINPNGGQDILTFTGEVKAENLNVEKYEPTLLATACYHYETVAGSPVCIDPNPYSTVEKKICEVHDIALASQGAPIAVTKIDEEAFATKTQFKITIKNVGGGDVIKETSFNKCGSSGEKVEREDIDKLKIEEVKISDKYLQCGPYSEGEVRGGAGLVRLINGEGYITCELPKSAYSAYETGTTAFTTPLMIKLSYVYRNTAERKLQIKKEISGIEGEKRVSQQTSPSPWSDVRIV